LSNHGRWTFGVVAGLVGFVDLIVSHVVRSLIGSAHRRLLVGCLFARPALMASADDAFVRLIANPIQVPAGINFDLKKHRQS
jgi:iron complex transport system permease protein